MITKLEIHLQVAALLSGSLTLEAFDEWLGVTSWDMHLDSTPEAQTLVGAIQLRLAEYAAGHLPATELTRQLETLTTADL